MMTSKAVANSASRPAEPRARLGRGLAALLGDAKVEPQSQEVFAGAKQVPIEFVRSNPRNPRQHFDESDLEDLASSIRERGIIQPIVVRPVVGVSDAYEIIAGERRWRAAQRAGLHTVPILPLVIADREALELSIIENVQRSDLSALEEARGYAQLAAEYGYSHSDVAKIIGKSRSYVANTMRLLALPVHTQDLLSSGAISAGHARALLAVEQPDAVADRIVARGLTVRDVEKLTSSPAAVVDRKPLGGQDSDVVDLAQRLSSALGVEIVIKNEKRARYMKIKFKDLEQLEYISSKLASLS